MTFCYMYFFIPLYACFFPMQVHCVVGCLHFGRMTESMKEIWEEDEGVTSHSRLPGIEGFPFGRLSVLKDGLMALCG